MEYNIYKYNIIRFHSRRYFMPAGAHTYIIVPYVFPRLSRWAVLSALTLGTCTYIIRRLEIRFHYTGTRQSVYGFIDTFIYIQIIYMYTRYIDFQFVSRAYRTSWCCLESFTRKQ